MVELWNVDRENALCWDFLLAVGSEICITDASKDDFVSSLPSSTVPSQDILMNVVGD